MIAGSRVVVGSYKKKERQQKTNLPNISQASKPKSQSVLLFQNINYQQKSSDGNIKDTATNKLCQPPENGVNVGGQEG